jgi:hypothetical protein
MTQAEMIREIQLLKAENEALKARAEARKPSVLTCKVSVKGAVSLYGLSRYPVTLYASQWQKLLQKKDEILAYIEANKSYLSSKEAKEDKAA